MSGTGSRDGRAGPRDRQSHGIPSQPFLEAAGGDSRGAAPDVFGDQEHAWRAAKMVSASLWPAQSVAGRRGARTGYARGDVDVAARRLARALGGVADSADAADRVAREAGTVARPGRRRNPVPARRQSSRAERRPHRDTGGARALAPALA